MDKLREALEECVRTTLWTNKGQHIAPSDLRLLYRRGRSSESSRLFFELFRPKLSDPSINRLATQLRSLLVRFISSDTDRIGNGLFALMGGPGNLREPTIVEFAQTLLKPATVLGPDRVIDLLSGWVAGEPLRFHKCSLLEGVEIERELRLPEGISLTKLSKSSTDLPAWLPFHIGTSKSEYLGRVVMSINCEMSPAIYTPSVKNTWKLSDKPQESFAYASRKIPNLSPDSFCESLSLACNHYVQWQLNCLDYGELGLFGNTFSGASYKAPSWAPKFLMSQMELELARSIHLERYSDSNKRGLDIAIRRWMNSKKRRSHEDKMIDLRIALEALYLKDGQGELSYRMAMSCAWHLGPTYESRHSYFKKLRDLYKIASKAVHGRGIKYTPKNKSILADAQEICRVGILKRLKEDTE